MILGPKCSRQTGLTPNMSSPSHTARLLILGKSEGPDCSFQFNCLEIEAQELSGPLNRLNAILSLLQPLDRYRTPIGKKPYLASKHSLGVLNRLILNRLARPQPRDSGAIVSKTPCRKQARNKNAIEAAKDWVRVLDRVESAGH